ncbi:hypothetical protein DPMN_066565 [Dreissena polymorpha]|uniref:Uncharacterized protein n=1 Tax=Dreissena polymorpha TaxID=45954 RepID=A0A9D3YTR3_DREPO|nr:hypothetical protein DPMN_066565 [Dreissena polymorpha]
MSRRARALASQEFVSCPRICKLTGRLGQASSNSPTNISSCPTHSRLGTDLSKPISQSATTTSFLNSPSTCLTPLTFRRGALGCTQTADPKPVTLGYSLE